MSRVKDKHCECGALIRRDSQRCRSCHARGLEVNQPRAETTDLHALAERARRRFPLTGLCEGCGVAPAEHRHHVDRDYSNYERSNILLLCRPCHTDEHRGELRHRSDRCKRGHLRRDHEYQAPGGGRYCRPCRVLRDQWDREAVAV